MDDSQIGQIVRDRNPWWRGQIDWGRDDALLREVAGAPFVYEPEILADVHPPGLYTLIGPRRVGKSVELRRAVAQTIAGGVDRRRVIYCSCDTFKPQDLRRLFVVGRNLTRAVSEPRFWFLDEVTAVGPDWSGVIKDVRDDTAVRDDCVVLTGSSAKGFREAVKNLAGRRGGVEDSDRILFPMGFRAFCDAVGGLASVPPHGPVRPGDMQAREALDAITELSYWTNDLVDAWEAYLTVGGYPRCVSDYLTHGDVQRDFVNDVWDVLRSDAITATSLADDQVLALLDRLGHSMATPLNATSVAADVGLGHHHAVNDRIQSLALVFLAWSCRQLITGRPSAKAFRKVYFIDPLLARLAELRATGYKVPDATKISEQQLGLALARAVQDEHPRSFVEASAVYYERTPTGSEIDFVGPSLDLPFESKYSDRSLKREILTVKSAYKRGILASRTVLDTSDREWIVPTGILAWLLGS